MPTHRILFKYLLVHLFIISPIVIDLFRYKKNKKPSILVDGLHTKLVKGRLVLFNVHFFTY